MSNPKIPVDLFPAIDAHLKNHRLFHTNFQIDCFVTACGGHHHPWGMYVQCLRELHSRRSTLEEREAFILRNEIDIEESRWKLSKRVWTRRGRFERRREAIKLNTLLKATLLYRENFLETERELTRFLEQAHQLRKLVGEEVLTEDRTRQLDQEYWLHRLKLRVANSVMVNGNVPVEVIDMLPSLDIEVRQPLMVFMAGVPNKTEAKKYLASLIPSTSLLELKSA